jgi:hypothetical protein
MRSPTLDPTAGERARALRLRPWVAHRITDPTDPRYGTVPPADPRESGPAGQIVDPTDPDCGQRSG